MRNGKGPKMAAARKKAPRVASTGRETAAPGPRLGRRGLVAAAAALVAGMAVAQPGERVAASGGGGDQGNLVLGSNPWYRESVIGNTPAISASPTVIQASPNFNNFTAQNGSDPVVFEVDARPSQGSIIGIIGRGVNFGDGLYGTSSDGNGVYGASSNYIGVYGSGNSYGVYGTGTTTGVYGGGTSYGVYGGGTSGGYGVRGTTGDTGAGVFGSYGSSPAAPSYNAGVVGTGPSGGQGVSGVCNGGNGWGVVGSTDVGVGVRGISTSGYGVRGSSTSGTGVDGSSGSGGIGVSGSASGGGTGVQGASQSGVGVYGTTAGGYGLLGQTGTANTFGLYGSGLASGAIGVGGVGYNGALAAQFSGPVRVYGQIILQQGSGGAGNAFVVGPGVTKNAALPHPDGSYRLYHCVESPEPWLEDFGEGKLTNGRAEVRLDPGFLGTVDTKTMHVFVNEVGQSSNVGVTAKSVAGFTVEADAALLAMRGRRMADANNSFSYRVVAKRKDVSGERLARIELPPEVKAPPLPKLAPFAAPTLPEKPPEPPKEQMPPPAPPAPPRR